ncbi:hypothetical protein PVAND_010116 [Polypedilum vanderplanki]|uniref:Uncharacterized protein n=1 Tax=Polypedilum vanderplanki TaxID=319348 RepID=A0A9J6CG85_POLVA|nr:hypothetical protein PVAND_010116 [Polypedilum vanderplanki]
MVYLCSTRGTTGTNQWHNTCPSGHWYEATFDGLCLNASKVVAIPEQQYLIKALITHCIGHNGRSIMDNAMLEPEPLANDEVSSGVP